MVPVATIRPLRISPIRSQVASTSDENVRRQQHCRLAISAQLAERVAEGLHHHRIETGRGLVEDQDGRSGHQRLDDPDLLLHPVRLIAQAPPQIDVADVEAAQQLGEIAARDRTAVRFREIVADSLPRSGPGRRAARRGDTRPAGARAGSRRGNPARAPTPAPATAGAGPQAAGSSWSCPRHSIPGTRRPRRARPRTTDPRRR